MHVYKMRTALDQLLRRGLSSDQIVVKAPDHPMILRAPDLLIGGNGSLTAIMLPTAEEARRPELCVSRFILSRVALPQETRFVLVVDEKDEAVAEGLVRQVSLVLGWRERQALTGIVARPGALKTREMPRDVREKTNERFATTYRLARYLNRRAQLRLRIRSSPRRAEVHFSRASDRNEVEFAAFDNQPNPADIAALTFEGAKRSYDLQDGVPFLNTAPSGAAFADTFPEARGDPDKFMRAAALSGWVLAPRGSRITPQQVADFLEIRTRSQ